MWASAWRHLAWAAVAVGLESEGVVVEGVHGGSGGKMHSLGLVLDSRAIPDRRRSISCKASASSSASSSVGSSVPGSMM